MTVREGGFESAQAYCRDRIDHYRMKADHNKREALTFSMVIICCTLISPILILIGAGAIVGKILPATLSSIAAGCTAWMQQRKPQQLWTLYRSTERLLESEIVSHQFNVGDYADRPDPDKLLIGRVGAICMAAHNLWTPLVPDPDKFFESLKSRGNLPGEKAQYQSSTTGGRPEGK